eukprot:Clim_evm28s142 gene=Clim_evmTU28s142
MANSISFKGESMDMDTLFLYFVAVVVGMQLLRMIMVPIRSRSVANPRLLGRQNVLLVIAHPDDESMFFGPLMAQLSPKANGQSKAKDNEDQHMPSAPRSPGASVPFEDIEDPNEDGYILPKLYVLCLSTGDADGKGSTRVQELKKVMELWGYDPEEQLQILDDPMLPDSMTAQWPQTIIQRYVRTAVQAWHVDTVITFDQGGISGHFNHIAIHKALVPPGTWSAKDYEALPVTEKRRKAEQLRRQQQKTKSKAKNRLGMSPNGHTGTPPATPDSKGPLTRSRRTAVVNGKSPGSKDITMSSRPRKGASKTATAKTATSKIATSKPSLAVSENHEPSATSLSNSNTPRLPLGKSVRILCLRSELPFLKYTGAIELFFRTLLFRKGMSVWTDARHISVAVNGVLFGTGWTCRTAMFTHWSQMVWFRWLYIFFSRYMTVNDFVVMVEGDSWHQNAIDVAAHGPDE